MKRLNSIDNNDNFGFAPTEVAAQKVFPYKVREVQTLSRHKINRKEQCERLAAYAERHGIHGIAVTGHEDEFSFLDEIDFANPLYSNEQWYEKFKGNELKSLFKERSKGGQNMSNFAQLKYADYQSDDSQPGAGKKRKRKRFNSGSSNQSKPRQNLR